MRRRATPPALAPLLLAVALAGACWALVVPAWQVPDEDAHFAYAQTIAELQRRPADDGRPLEEGSKSTEQQLAERATGFRGSYQRLEADPALTAAEQQRFERAEAALDGGDRADGGGVNAAGVNPPTFYAYSALSYEAAGGTVLDRLYAMRLWSVPLLVVFALSAWLLAGELTRRDRVAQLCAGALAGLLPMATFISASVSPDAMVMPLWGLTTWLGVRGLRRGFRRAGAVAFVAAALAAMAIKPIGVALAPAVLWALGVALWRRRGAPPLPHRAVLGGLAAVAALAAALALVLIPGSPRGFLGYLWQFYLPELPGQRHTAGLEPWPLRDVWFEGLTGAFGWLELRFPGPVYALLLAVGVLLAVGAVRALRGRVGPPTAVFLTLPALALLAGLHLTEYRFLVLDDSAFSQGRYLLPLAASAAAAAGAGLGALRGPWRARAAALLLGGLVAWQLGSLAIVTARFYA